MTNILKGEDSHKDDFDLSLNDLYDQVFTDEVDTPDESSFDILSAQKERYIKEEEIGRGGAKKIIKVFDTRARRYLAMALPHSSEQNEKLNAFIREAWITAQLDHPNIIKIHEVGVNPEKLPFFTMDLKNGDSLEFILRKLYSDDPIYLEKYPLIKRLEFFIKICDAIAYAHSVNILHLDLKPDNIQIGEYGEVIVCDWGLAKIVGGRKSINLHRDLLELDLAEKESSLIMGTPAYMAPEQVKGDKTNTLSDVYGLAAILYHIVTLNPSITTDDASEAMAQTLKGSIPSPHELVPVSEGLSSIIMKGLALEASERYPSVMAFKNDLSKYLEGYVTNAEDSTFLKQCVFFYRRNKMICRQAILFLFLIISITFWFVNSLQQSWKLEQEARIQAEENAFKQKQALDLYIKEKEQGALVKKDFSGVLVKRYQIYNSEDFSKDPEAMLLGSLKGYRYALEQNPNDSHIAMMTALTLFILQRYDEAQKFNGKHKQLEQIQLALKAVNKHSYTKGQKNVPVTVFVSALKGLREYGHTNQATAYRAILYDMKTRDNFDGYEKVVEQALMLWNDRWIEPEFHYDKETQSLHVHGDKFSNLGMYDKFGRQALLLKPLIKHLDVSNSEVEDLTYLYGSQIESLNISNTYVNDLSPLLKLNKLRQLTITEKQFSKEELELLPSKIKVIYTKQ
ncbi:serine/threonine-protein kinase [Lentisphaera profundi]|uniref:Serine/threonine-protein kinase n=1 Tax=Lentisphaera profundi TaxID=1658616 RepID=A0ABY7VTR3_9BACT|nr:serine/threonine-protein kinase [Lentisphaera profundi]WDE97595.1 serine/threonine-protein kinase [Lentisphaera profundi]